MRSNCQDVFKKYNLPFDTFFYECVSHGKSVHDELEIIWVLKGQAYISMGDEKYIVKNQNVFLVYMGQEHTISSDPNTIIIAYRIHNDYLHRKGLFFEKIPYKPRVNSFDYLADRYHQVPLLLVQILKLLLSDENHDIIRHKILGYFNFYVNELYNMLLKERYLDVKTIDYDIYLNRIHIIVEYIYHHFQEKVSLDDLSEVTGLSNFRLSHFIKEALGISFYQFLQNARFEHALNLIRNTNLSIAKIAEDSGFSEHKYLSEMMKKKYHMTPLKYRKSINEKDRKVHFTVSNNNIIRELRMCLKKLEEDERYASLFKLDAIA